MKTLVVVLGPTAAGKTALAIDVAKSFKTEILSADSRQFYKGMDIGTAKPTLSELKSIPHHFIDSLTVDTAYTVGTFETEALNLLDSLFKKHDTVVMAGGSGLYIQAVCNGLDKLPPTDPLLREQLHVLLQEKGIASLQEKLRLLDAEYYATVDLQNPHRLIRALEVCMITGDKYSSLRRRKIQPRPFHILKIGLRPLREELYQRIDKRVDEMITNGLVEEVKKFLPWRNFNALQTVGYKELFPFFEGAITIDAAISEIKKHSRNYAKRQMTWFNKDPDIRWFAPGHSEEILVFLHDQLRQV